MSGLEEWTLDFLGMLLCGWLLLIPFWILNGALHNDKT